MMIIQFTVSVTYCYFSNLSSKSRKNNQYWNEHFWWKPVNPVTPDMNCLSGCVRQCRSFSLVSGSEDLSLLLYWTEKAMKKKCDCFLVTVKCLQQLSLSCPEAVKAGEENSPPNSSSVLVCLEEHKALNGNSPSDLLPCLSVSCLVCLALQSFARKVWLHWICLVILCFQLSLIHWFLFHQVITFILNLNHSCFDW